MSVSSFDPTAQAVTVTDKALRYFQRNAGQHSAEGKSLIRLSVGKSGCSGYAYELDFVDAAQSQDQIIELAADLQLALDPEAVSVLRGTEIDLVTEGLNQTIKFNNPNVVAECGCGESFSVG
jgi:Fe-S cluster assembly protein SufA/iron-sulfur cluster assembly protein